MNDQHQSKEGTTMTITRRGLTRGAAVAAITIAAAVAAFFVGQSTRMSDTARVSERNAAVATTARIEEKRADDRANVLKAINVERAQADARHERKAVRKVRRETRRLERKRAARLARQATASGYSSGNAAGHSSGVQDGLHQGSDELGCTDDASVTWLPYCGINYEPLRHDHRSDRDPVARPIPRGRP